MIDLNEIAKDCLKISKIRITNGSKIDNDPLKALSGEVVEAVEAREHYERWKSRVFNQEGVRNIQNKYRLEYAEELADSAICLMTAAAKDGIDIEGAIFSKVEKNKKRALEVGDKL